VIFLSKFEESEWAEKKHAQEFIDKADIFILERKRIFEILKSFYRYFLENNIIDRTVKVLDLGCGSGAITRELLSVSDKMEVVLVDGSSDMLENAREDLISFNTHCVHKTFQELLENESSPDDLLTNFDFIVSSLAIHHLYTEEKEDLFKYIYNQLNPGGYFLNIDTIKAPTDELESWYRVLWSEWIGENEDKMKKRKTWPHSSRTFVNLPKQYKNNPDNHPDKLSDQLKDLESAGFRNVDCHYKYGIFAMYGGQK
jgi:tRNA (cmo5U34)-methyltransferase